MGRLFPTMLLASALCLFVGCGLQTHRAVPIQKALWVKRWDYLTADQVRAAIDRAADAGFDTVFFQVRGNGTVFYKSKIEPWAEEFGHQDPGFDPLEVACTRARARGIALHAWVNALAGWRGAEPPPVKIGQLYTTHPEWFLYDAEAEREPLNREYVQLNPCWPEARAHVVSVIEEIVTQYDVAGIHLDYIRFLGDFREEGKDYPFDPTTLLAYEQAGGKAPAEEPEKWNQWRTECVTSLVKEIRGAMITAKPNALLTAAVFATPEVALATQQDWVRWLRRGWIDAAVPMIYSESDEAFERKLRECLAVAPGESVIAGVGVYRQTDPEQFVRQMVFARESGAAGVALYDYSSFYDPETPCPRPRIHTELRGARLAILNE